MLVVKDVVIVVVVVLMVEVVEVVFVGWVVIDGRFRVRLL